MRKDIHPNYREVIFFDLSTEFKFLTKSCVNTKDKMLWEDGKEYPVYKVEVSSDSHPFYTGKNVLVDMTGRVDKFRKRYNR
jgi:large subunit ribosomal protein L31